MAFWRLVLPVALVVSLFLGGLLSGLFAPMISRIIEPSTLGSLPNTATTIRANLALLHGVPALGFFLALSLAHFATLRGQILIHLSFVVLAGCAVYFVGPGPASPAIPAAIAAILVFLASISVPLVLLSFAAKTGLSWAREPCFLVCSALLGSCVGTAVYPWFVEPNWPLPQQMSAWKIGFFSFAACVWLAGGLIWRARSRQTGDIRCEVNDASPKAVTPIDRMCWVALAAIPYSVASGVVTHIATDISPIPMLFFIPAVFLGFSWFQAFARLPFPQGNSWLLPAIVQMVAGLAYGGFFASLAVRSDVELFLIGVAAPVATSLIALAAFLPHRAICALQPLTALIVFAVYCSRSVPINIGLSVPLLGFLLIASMCAGELVRRRPHGEHLVEYFFWIYLGILLARVFNGFVAPKMFDEVHEYWLMFVAACMLRPNWRRHGLVDGWLLQRWFGQAKEGEPGFVRLWLPRLFDVLVPIALGLATRSYLQLFDRDGMLALKEWILVLPFLLCLVTVPRPVRFGLSLGAVLWVLRGMLWEIEREVYHEYFGILR